MAPGGFNVLIKNERKEGSSRLHTFLYSAIPLPNLFLSPSLINPKFKENHRDGEIKASALA